jgi:hypothetical protein
VEKIVNIIEVLPTSMNDDRIRRDTYGAIYGNESLNQHQLRAIPTIHIIVANGHVTLEGAVARQMEKQIAGMQANQVPGIFSGRTTFMWMKKRTKNRLGGAISLNRLLSEAGQPVTLFEHFEKLLD